MNRIRTLLAVAALALLAAVPASSVGHVSASPVYGSHIAPNSGGAAGGTPI